MSHRVENRTAEKKKSKSSLYGNLFRTTARDPRFFRLYMLGLLLIYCTLFYYAGELIDYFHWESLRWSFFYAVHDVHRLLFLAPILYAAHAFGVRATIIITLVSGGIWAPRAFFFSPYPSPVLRAALFLIIEGAIGYLTALSFRQNRRVTRLEAEVRAERDKLIDILERMGDGVIIIGPDYRVRFTNETMRKVFGNGDGLPCYKYIYHFLEPCGEHCKLAEVLKGATERWEYTFPDGTTFEVVAVPFIDSDGTVCQLCTYRNITRRKTR